MTANVSFYLIAILAQRVKSHSLQESNVFIVDRDVKNNNILYIYIYIFTWTVRKALNAISDQNKP